MEFRRKAVLSLIDSSLLEHDGQIVATAPFQGPRSGGVVLTERDAVVLLDQESLDYTDIGRDFSIDGLTSNEDRFVLSFDDRQFPVSLDEDGRDVYENLRDESFYPSVTMHRVKATEKLQEADDQVTECVQCGVVFPESNDSCPSCGLGGTTTDRSTDAKTASSPPRSTAGTVAQTDIIPGVLQGLGTVMLNPIQGQKTVVDRQTSTQILCIGLLFYLLFVIFSGAAALQFQQRVERLGVTPWGSMETAVETVQESDQSNSAANAVRAVLMLFAPFLGFVIIYGLVNLLAQRALDPSIVLFSSGLIFLPLGLFIAFAYALGAANIELVLFLALGVVCSIVLLVYGTLTEVFEFEPRQAFVALPILLAGGSYVLSVLLRSLL